MSPQATEISPATFLQANPVAAKRLAGQWFDFALRHREIEDFGSKEQLDAWLKTHPDIRVDSKQLWYGKQLGETYFAMQEQHEQSQMQTGEGIDTDHNLSELAGLIALPIALLYKPKLMEDDHGYQKIEEKKKEEWLKTNNKKDFNSKEGLDYLYGSLDNPETPTLRQEAEAAFRENPKNAKKLARYDKEKKAFYKNLDSDPAIARLKETVNEHTYARYELLKQTDKTITPEQVQKQVEEKVWERFVENHPEKAQAYSQEKYDKHNQDIKTAVTRVEKRKKEQAIAEETRQMVSHKTHKAPDMSVAEASQRLANITPPPSIPILIPPIHPPSPSGLIDTQGRPLSSSHPAPTHTQPPHVQRPMPQSRTTSLINNANRLASMFRSDNTQGGGKSLIDRGNDAYDTYRKAQSAIRAARTGVQMARTAVSAVRGAVLLANPYTWIVIGVVLFILLIVIIIVVILKPGQDLNVPTEGKIPGLTLDLRGPATSANGKEITYSIAATYGGPLDVTINDPIPSNADYVSSEPPGKIEGNVVSWRLKDIAASTAQRQYTIAIALRSKTNDSSIANQVFANAQGSGGFSIDPGQKSGNACTQNAEGTGYCAVSNLTKYFGDNAIIASLICNAESQGDALALNTNCTTNDYSVGLFQVNLVAHCPGAYANQSCQNLIDINKRATCEVHFKNPEENIKKAVELSSGGTNWKQWGAWPAAEKKLRECNIIR